MPIFLKQSTASQEVPLGYFVDSGDGDTEETGLTIANTDIKLWKAGATTLANKNSGGATHISNGVYYCVLDDTDTDTAGPLVLFVHVSGALSVRVECAVLPANVYDSLFGSDKLQVDIVEASAALTEAYASDGAAATLAQLLYQIWSMLAEKSVSGTTLTAKKLDGSTTSMTFTLSDASNPTSITRAT